jgi:hypothetical protein
MTLAYIKISHLLIGVPLKFFSLVLFFDIIKLKTLATVTRRIYFLLSLDRQQIEL